MLVLVVLLRNTPNIVALGIIIANMGYHIMDVKMLL